MRVLVTLRFVLVMAFASAMGACGGSDGEDLTGIRTGFESREASGWTSLAEERSFLRELDAASERVTVSEIGRSVQDRPIRLVTVGQRRTREQVAAGSSVLFVCAQHGEEPAGREACLQAARDAVDEVGSNTLLIIPTANPDGSVAGNRGNADDVSINVDHQELTTPEAKAIAAVLTEYKPDLVGDFHEYKEEGADRVLLGNPDDLHLNVDPSIRQLTSRLHDYAVRSLHADDFAEGFWPTLKENANDAVLRQQAALRHSPSLLVETPRRGTLSARERVGAHRAAGRAILKMLREQQPELADATASARRGAVAEGAGDGGRYYYASPTRHTDTPPCGYLITEDDYQGVKATLLLHGIDATFSRGSWEVSTAQASQPLIGLLLDARAPEQVTTSEPVACRPSQ